MEECEVALDETPLEPLKKPESALPWKVIPVYIALWCEAFNSSSIFAYVGYMVLDFGMSSSESDPKFMYVFVLRVHDLLLCEKQASTFFSPLQSLLVAFS